jgi:hypothetical protein
METIKDKIVELRPSLSKQSVATYCSLLKSLHTNVYGDKLIDIKDFENSKKINDYLKSVVPTKRKTTLSALVVLTDMKEYRDQMLDDIETYNKEQSTQDKNEKQSESWVETDDVKKLLEKYSIETKMLYKKKSLTTQELQQIQNYIILCLLGGEYIPPRRSKDFVDFKIKNIDKSVDNFMEKNKLNFNSYKTASTYGLQSVELPKALKSILVKWVKHNPTDYLLFDNNLNKLSNVKLNQRLNKMFGKKASTNQMRHTYMSNKYKNTSNEMKMMDKDFTAMGSSMAQHMVYVKN